MRKSKNDHRVLWYDVRTLTESTDIAAISSEQEKRYNTYTSTLEIKPHSVGTKNKKLDKKSAPLLTLVLDWHRSCNKERDSDEMQLNSRQRRDLENIASEGCFFGMGVVLNCRANQSYMGGIRFLSNVTQVIVGPDVDNRRLFVRLRSHLFMNNDSTKKNGDVSSFFVPNRHS